MLWNHHKMSLPKANIEKVMAHLKGNSCKRGFVFERLSVLERCLYLRGICIRATCIREVSVLDRFLY